MKDANGNRAPLAGILGGLALGALAMYIFDPVQGNRRRAMVRDKVDSLKAKSRETAQAAARDFANRSRGTAAEVRRPTADDPGADGPTAETMSQSLTAP